MDSVDMGSSSGRKMASFPIFAYLTSFLYIIFGAVQILKVFDAVAFLEDLILVPEDLMGGLVLMVIGIVFLFGGRKYGNSANEGLSFLLVAGILGLFFSMVYSLILFADIAEAELLMNEDWDDWAMVDSIRPGIYLGILSAMHLLISFKKLRTRTRNNKQDRRC